MDIARPFSNSNINKPASLQSGPSRLAGLFSLLIIAIIGGLMVAGYLHMLVPITLQIDGVPYPLRTHQLTVEGILTDVGITTFPEDEITPPINEQIQAGQVIQIRRARPVRVEVDGKIIAGRTLKHSVLSILADLGIEVSPYDKIIVSNGDNHTSSRSAAALASSLPMGQASYRAIQLPEQSPLEVTVQRAMTVTLNLDGQSAPLHTTALSVGEALHEAGLILHEADRTLPEMTTPVDANMTISVKTAIPLTILVDGRRLRTRTHRANVADALAEVNIALTGLDYTHPDLDSALTPDMEIRVVRVHETFSIEQEPVPFEVVWMPDSDLEIDLREQRQDGENGVLQKRIRVRYEDGQEVSRKLEDQGIVRPPKNKIITYGTNIVVRTLDTPHGAVEYWRRIRMLATSYSASTAGTPVTASYYGRTALGWIMRHGIVAIDPRVVHLGSNVYVPGYGPGAAGDTGGAIKGRRIDLGYDDDNLKLWYRWVDVYLLTPIPPGDSINYVIPDWPPEP